MRPAKRLLRPTIRTERLTLRPVTEADLDAVVAGIGNLAVSRMLARVPYPYTRRDADWFFDYADRSTDAGTLIYLGIDDGSGLVGGMSIEAIPYTSEIGYWLAEPAWGRGYMTEAATALTAYGFDVLGLRLLRSGFFAENAGSRGVQRKLGFRQTGRSLKRSLARGTEVEHIDTVLTPARFREAVS